MRIIKHGTSNEYVNHGCRCDPCKAARSAYMKARTGKPVTRPAHHKTPGPKPFPYSWRGKDYAGLKSIADAAGVQVKAVQNHLARHGNLDRLRTKEERGLAND